MDHPNITNPQAKFFLSSFSQSRAINRKFYELVPKEQYDYRMVENKSDSVKESLIHQITITRNYALGIKEGVQEFGKKYDDLKPALGKIELLQKLSESEIDLSDALAVTDIDQKRVKTKIGVERPALSWIWGLDYHEVLHTGWNLAIMDHLGIKRYPELQAMWGV